MWACFAVWVGEFEFKAPEGPIVGRRNRGRRWWPACALLVGQSRGQAYRFASVPSTPAASSEYSNVKEQRKSVRGGNQAVQVPKPRNLSPYEAFRSTADHLYRYSRFLQGENLGWSEGTLHEVREVTRERLADNFELSAFPGLIVKESCWRWPERNLAGNSIDFFVQILKVNFDDANAVVHPQKPKPAPTTAAWSIVPKSIKSGLYDGSSVQQSGFHCPLTSSPLSVSPSPRKPGARRKTPCYASLHHKCQNITL